MTVKKFSSMAAAFAVLLMAVSWALSAEETISFGRFGEVTLYAGNPRPARVALFVSGDGGWNKGVVDMARAMTGMDALVVGIDITRFLARLAAAPEKCVYPAADFEMLSKYVQKLRDFPDYVQPLLVGYSSGATLVYALLAQAPPGTFAGAVSLGFCPDLPLKKPLCKGYGLEWRAGPGGKGVVFLPVPRLAAPWIALQGTIDQVCDAASTRAYVGQVEQGEIIMLEHVGHGFSVQRNWLPQFLQACQKVFTPAPAAAPLARAEAAPAPVADLPLVEVLPDRWQKEYMAVVVSGDGGWAAIDRSIGNALAASGVGVVGFNSLKYFWKKRTPAEAGRDLQRLLDHYLPAWKKKQAVLVGYSLGADVLPFMVNGLSPAARSAVRLVALLGPSREVDFEFHLSDWLGSFSHGSSRPVRPEVEKLRGLPILCFYGEDESDSLCHDLDPGLARCIPLRGGHHFGGDYQSIAAAILDAGK
jgi:type IV secretory pathway VirJ component